MKFADSDHYEIERKFLIEYPDIEWLENSPFCRRTEIVQTYLNAAPGEEIRVRKREGNGNCIYFKTVKRKISGIRRVENERRISREEYEKLLLDADRTRRPIQKTRYCLDFNGQCFEIDVYPFWTDKAIAEIELADESEEIIFPAQIKVIKEVTDDDSYKNAALAKI